MATRGANGKFVAQAPVVAKPRQRESRRRRQRKAGPVVSVAHVDARLAALEGAITHTTATLRDAVVQGAEKRLETDQQVVDAMSKVKAAVDRLPGEASCSLVDELERRLSEDRKLLHRRVMLQVLDSQGVEISKQFFDLDRDEQLDVTVTGAKVSASQAQVASAR